MISSVLRSRLACPACLQEHGCARCSRPGTGHAVCESEYAERVRCPCGGPDKVPLEAQDQAALVCPCCGTRYALHGEDGGYADLVSPGSLGEVTRYADHEFQERLGVTDAPPLLSARVKADMMRRMLDLRPGETVLDLGCGAAKFALYAAGAGARVTGLDIAPFFLPRALRSLDLVRGDLRRLPFCKGSFARAYTLDVLEHLDEPGVEDVLIEARRVLAPQGRLFVYTHAMESSWLAGFQRGVNRLAKRLGRAGFIDHEREALRKSDHVNAIRSHEHFDELSGRAGLRVAERRYYNVVFKAVIEDLGLRLYEQARRSLRARTPARPSGSGAGLEYAGSRSESRPPPRLEGGPPPGRLALSLALVLTWFLKLDVVLFSGLRTGPFFARLQPRGTPVTPEQEEQ